MSSLQVTARFTIQEGKLPEFKVLAARCMASVREKDSGTLQYDWFLSEDESECIVRETYRDSAALLEHLGNVGEILGALLGVADFDLEVYGSPSEELIAATAAMTPKIYSTFQRI